MTTQKKFFEKKLQKKKHFLRQKFLIKDLDKNCVFLIGALYSANLRGDKTGYNEVSYLGKFLATRKTGVTSNKKIGCITKHVYQYGQHTLHANN